jgi:predicted permease
MGLLVIYIASVLVIAVKVQNTRQIPWIVIILAVGNPLLPYLTGFLFWHILPPLNLPHELYHTDPLYWRYTLLIAVQQAVNAIPLGLLVGIMLGFEGKSNSSTIPA